MPQAAARGARARPTLSGRSAAASQAAHRLQCAAAMMTNFSNSFLPIVVIGTVLGQSGCGSDAIDRTPDGDAGGGADGCPVATYRITSVTIPITLVDAMRLSFDLDGDGTRDNWLGIAAAVLESWSPSFDLEPALAARLAADELGWLVAVTRCEDEPVAARLVQRGAVDDGGRAFAVPLGALSDALGGAAPGWVLATLGQVRLDAVDDQALEAVVGFAVDEADVRAIVAANLATYFTHRLALDDSPFAEAADVDGDRVVTVDELMATDLARALLAPDLDAGSSVGIGVGAER